MPWYGNLADIPNGFIYCDGTNGTPDLRGRTLIGTGTWADSYGSELYLIGATGGARMHKLTIAELPSHSHSQHQWTVYGDSSSFSIKRKTGMDSFDAVGTLGNNGLPARYTNNVGGGQAHENRPPYMAVHWIMKL